MKHRDMSWQRRCLSGMIAFLCLPRLLFKRKIPQTIKTILVIDWQYLGDIIVAVPAIRAVKERYPNAKITLLTNPENTEYADSFDFVDKRIYIRNPLQLGRRQLSLNAIVETIRILRQNSYDIVIELSGRLTSQFFLFFIKSRYFVGQDPTRDFYWLDASVTTGRIRQLERNLEVLKLLNIETCSKSLWDPSQTEEVFVDNLLKAKNISKKYVVIHPLASWQPKEWPPENWNRVADFLIKNNFSVIFIGTQNEFEKIEKVRQGLDPKNTFNFAGLVNITQLIAFIKKSAFFLGTDSGPMHVAAIGKVKSLVLFGPGDPELWTHKDHTVIYKKPECGPCAQLAYRTLCSEGLSTCKGLTAITPQEVISRCQELITQ